MPRYHLQHQDGSWSDLAEYETMPVQRPEGTWMQGEPTGPVFMFKDASTVVAFINQVVSGVQAQNAGPNAYDLDAQIDLILYLNGVKALLENNAVSAAKRYAQKFDVTTIANLTPTQQATVQAIQNEIVSEIGSLLS